MFHLNKKNAVVAVAIIYGVLLFVGLILLRLPAHNLIPYFVERASKGRVVLRAERTSFSLPTGCKLEKVSYAVLGRDRETKGRLESLALDMNFFGLAAGRLPISFEARPMGQGGKIQGNAAIPLWGSFGKTYFEMKVSEVDLENMGLAAISGRDLKGHASGQMKFKGDFTDPGTVLGEGWLLLKNGSVDTRLEVAGLKAVPFESVQVPFTIKNGRLLLEKGEMQGPMLSGTLSGQVTLNKKIGDSVLDLTARLKPGPLFDNNPLAGAVLSKIKGEGKKIILKIGGSVRQPTMAWSSG